jgi:hypothetical protein
VVAQKASAAPNVTAQQIGGIGAIDAGQFGSMTGERAGGGSKLAHNINPQSVMQQAMRTFQSQLPQMDIEFADASDQLAKKTAAMGRTGSGLFNRDTGYISDRARAKRESTLGNLAFGAATTDASNSLQAQIQQQQLREAQEGRFANTNVANMQSNNALLGQSQGNMLQALLGNQRTALSSAQSNQDAALRAAMANQSSANQMGQFNVGEANSMGQFNAQNDINAQMQNLANQISQNQFGANFMQQQQGYQNQLANQAQQDFINQMNMFGQGFNYDPGSAMIGAGAGMQGIAGMYGDQAGMANQQMGQGMQSLMQMLMMGGAPPGGVSGQGPRPQQGYLHDPNNPAFNPQSQLFGQGPQPIGLQPGQPQGLVRYNMPGSRMDGMQIPGLNSQGLDPMAIQADPAGFQNWLQQKQLFEGGMG